MCEKRVITSFVTKAWKENFIWVSHLMVTSLYQFMSICSPSPVQLRNIPMNNLTISDFKKGVDLMKLLKLPCAVQITPQLMEDFLVRTDHVRPLAHVRYVTHWTQLIVTYTCTHMYLI